MASLLQKVVLFICILMYATVQGCAGGVDCFLRTIKLSIPEVAMDGMKLYPMKCHGLSISRLISSKVDGSGSTIATFNIDIQGLSLTCDDLSAELGGFIPIDFGKTWLENNRVKLGLAMESADRYKVSKLSITTCDVSGITLQTAKGAFWRSALNTFLNLIVCTFLTDTLSNSLTDLAVNNLTGLLISQIQPHMPFGDMIPGYDADDLIGYGEDNPMMQIMKKFNAGEWSDADPKKILNCFTKTLTKGTGTYEVVTEGFLTPDSPSLSLPLAIPGMGVITIAVPVVALHNLMSFNEKTRVLFHPDDSMLDNSNYFNVANFNAGSPKGKVYSGDSALTSVSPFDLLNTISMGGLGANVELGLDIDLTTADPEGFIQAGVLQEKFKVSAYLGNPTIQADLRAPSSARRVEEVRLASFLAGTGILPCSISMFDGSWEYNGGMQLIQLFANMQLDLGFSVVEQFPFNNQLERDLSKLVNDVLKLFTNSFGALFTDFVHGLLDSTLRPMLNSMLKENFDTAKAECDANADKWTGNWDDSLFLQLVTKVEEMLGGPEGMIELGQCIMPNGLPEMPESADDLLFEIAAAPEEFPFSTTPAPADIHEGCDDSALNCWLKTVQVAIPKITIEHALASAEVSNVHCKEINVGQFTTGLENTNNGDELSYIFATVEGIKLQCAADVYFASEILGVPVDGSLSPEFATTNTTAGFAVSVLSDDGYKAKGARLADCKFGLEVKLKLVGGLVPDILSLFMGSVEDLISTIVGDMFCDAMVDFLAVPIDEIARNTTDWMTSFVYPPEQVGPLNLENFQTEDFVDFTEYKAFQFFESFNNGGFPGRSPAGMLNCVSESYTNGTGDTVIDTSVLMGEPLKVVTPIDGFGNLTIAIPEIRIRDLDTITDVSVLRNNPTRVPDPSKGETAFNTTNFVNGVPVGPVFSKFSNTKKTSDYDFFSGVAFDNLGISFDVNVRFDISSGMVHGASLDETLTIDIDLVDPALTVDFRMLMSRARLSSASLGSFLAENSLAACALSLFDESWDNNGGVQLLQAFFHAKLKLAIGGTDPDKPLFAGIDNLLTDVAGLVTSSFGALFTDVVHGAVDNYVRPMVNDYLKEMALTATTNCTAAEPVVGVDKFDWRNSFLNAIMDRVADVVIGAVAVEDVASDVVSDVTGLNSTELTNWTKLGQCFMPDDLQLDNESYQYRIGALNVQPTVQREMTDCTQSDAPLTCFVENLAVSAPEMALIHPVFNVTLESLECGGIDASYVLAGVRDPSTQMSPHQVGDIAAFFSEWRNTGISCAASVFVDIEVMNVRTTVTLTPSFGISEAFGQMEVVVTSKDGYKPSGMRFDDCAFDTKVNLALPVTDGLIQEAIDYGLNTVADMGGEIAKSVLCEILDFYANDVMHEISANLTSFAVQYQVPHEPVGAVDVLTLNAADYLPIRETRAYKLIEKISTANINGRNIVQISNCIGDALTNNTGTATLDLVDLLATLNITDFSKPEFALGMEGIADLKIAVPEVRFTNVNKWKDMHLFQRNSLRPGNAFNLANLDDVDGAIGPVTAARSSIRSASNYDVFTTVGMQKVGFEIDLVVDINLNNTGTLQGESYQQVMTVSVELGNPTLEFDVRALLNTAKLDSTPLGLFLAENGTLPCAMSLFDGSLNSNGGLQLLQSWFHSTYSLRMKEPTPGGMVSAIDDVLKFVTTTFRPFITDAIHAAMDNWMRPMANEYIRDLIASSSEECAAVVPASTEFNWRENDMVVQMVDKVESILRELFVESEEPEISLPFDLNKFISEGQLNAINECLLSDTVLDTESFLNVTLALGEFTDIPAEPVSSETCTDKSLACWLKKLVVSAPEVAVSHAVFPVTANLDSLVCRDIKVVDGAIGVRYGDDITSPLKNDVASLFVDLESVGITCAADVSFTTNFLNVEISGTVSPSVQIKDTTVGIEVNVAGDQYRPKSLRLGACDFAMGLKLRLADEGDWYLPIEEAANLALDTVTDIASHLALETLCDVLDNATSSIFQELGQNVTQLINDYVKPHEALGPVDASVDPSLYLQTVNSPVFQVFEKFNQGALAGRMPAEMFTCALNAATNNTGVITVNTTDLLGAVAEVKVGMAGIADVVIGIPEVRINGLTSVTEVSLFRSGPVVTGGLNAANYNATTGPQGQITNGASQAEATSEFDLFNGFSSDFLNISVDLDLGVFFNATGMLQGAALEDRLTVDVQFANPNLAIDFRALVDLAALDRADLGRFLSIDGLLSCGMDFFQSSFAQNGGLQLIQSFFNAKYTLHTVSASQNGLINTVEQVLGLATGTFGELLTDAVHTGLDNAFRPVVNDWLRELAAEGKTTCQTMETHDLYAFDWRNSPVADVVTQVEDLVRRILRDGMPESNLDTNALMGCFLPEDQDVSQYSNYTLTVGELVDIPAFEGPGSAPCLAGDVACWVRSLQVVAPEISFEHSMVNATVESIVCNGVKFDSMDVSFGAAPTVNGVPVNADEISALNVLLSNAGVDCSVDVSYAADALGVSFVGSMGGSITISKTNVGLNLAVASADQYKPTGLRVHGCNFGTDLHFDVAVTNQEGFVDQVTTIAANLVGDIASSMATNLVCDIVDILGTPVFEQVGQQVADLVGEFITMHSAVGPLASDLEQGDYLNLHDNAAIQLVDKLNDATVDGKTLPEMINCAMSAILGQTGGFTLDLNTLLSQLNVTDLTNVLEFPVPGVMKARIEIPSVSVKSLNSFRDLSLLRLAPVKQGISHMNENFVNGVASGPITTGHSAIKATSDFDLFNGLSLGNLGASVDVNLRLVMNETGLLQTPFNLVQRVTANVELADATLEVDIRALLDIMQLDGVELGLFFAEGGLTTCGLSFFESSVAQNGGLQLLQAFFNAKYSVSMTEKSNSAMIKSVNALVGTVLEDFDSLITDAVHSAIDNIVRPMANDYIRELIANSTADCASVVPVTPSINWREIQIVTDLITQIENIATGAEEMPTMLSIEDMVAKLPITLPFALTTESVQAAGQCFMPANQTLTADLLSNVTLALGEFTTIPAEEPSAEACTDGSMTCWIKKLIVSAPTIAVSHQEFPVVANVDSLVCRNITLIDGAAGVLYGSEITAAQAGDIAAVFVDVDGAGLVCNVDLSFKATIMDVEVSGSLHPSIAIKDTNVAAELVIAGDAYKASGFRLGACEFGMGLGLRLNIDGLLTPIADALDLVLDTTTDIATTMAQNVLCDAVDHLTADIFTELSQNVTQLIKDYVKPHEALGPVDASVDPSLYLQTVNSPVFQVFEKFNQGALAGRMPAEMFKCVLDASTNSTGVLTISPTELVGDLATIALGVEGIADVKITIPQVRINGLNSVTEVSLFRSGPVKKHGLNTANYNEIDGAIGQITNGASQAEATSEFDLFNGFSSDFLNISVDLDLGVFFNATGMLQGAALQDSLTIDIELANPNLAIDFRALVDLAALDAAPIGKFFTVDGMLNCGLPLFESSFAQNGGLQLIQSFFNAKYTLHTTSENNLGVISTVEQVLGLATGSFGGLLTDAVHVGLDNLFRPVVNDWLRDLAVNGTETCATLIEQDMDNFDWRSSIVMDVVTQIENLIRQIARTGIPEMSLDTNAIANCFIAEEDVQSASNFTLTVGDLTAIEGVQLAFAEECAAGDVSCFVKALTVVAPKISLEHSLVNATVNSVVCNGINFVGADGGVQASAAYANGTLIHPEEIAQIHLALNDAGLQCDAALSYSADALGVSFVGTLNAGVSIRNTSAGVKVGVDSADKYKPTGLRVNECAFGTELGFDVIVKNEDGFVDQITTVVMDYFGDIATHIINNVVCDVVTIIAEPVFEQAQTYITEFVTEYVQAHNATGPVSTELVAENYFNIKESSVFQLVDKFNAATVGEKTLPEVANCAISAVLPSGSLVVDVASIIDQLNENLPGFITEYGLDSYVNVTDILPLKNGVEVSVPGIIDVDFRINRVGLHGLNTLQKVNVLALAPATIGDNFDESKLVAGVATGPVTTGVSAIDSSSDYDLFTSFSAGHIGASADMTLHLNLNNSGLLQGNDITVDVALKVDIDDLALEVDLRSLLDTTHLNGVELGLFFAEGGLTTCGLSFFESSVAQNGGLQLLQAFFNAKYNVDISEKNGAEVIQMVDEIISLVTGPFGAFITDAVHSAVDNLLRPIANDYIRELIIESAANCTGIVPAAAVFNWQDNESVMKVVAKVEDLIRGDVEIPEMLSVEDLLALLPLELPFAITEEVIENAAQCFTTEEVSFSMESLANITVAVGDFSAVPAVTPSNVTCAEGTFGCWLKQLVVSAPEIAISHNNLPVEVTLDSLICRDIQFADVSSAGVIRGEEITGFTAGDMAALAVDLTEAGLHCAAEVSFKATVMDVEVVGSVAPAVTVKDTTTGLEIVIAGDNYKPQAFRLGACDFAMGLQLRLATEDVPTPLAQALNLALDTTTDIASHVAKNVLCDVVDNLTVDLFEQLGQNVTQLVQDYIHPHVAVGPTAYDLVVDDYVNLRSNKAMQIIDAAHITTINGKSFSELANCVVSAVVGDDGDLALDLANIVERFNLTEAFDISNVFSFPVDGVADIALEIPAVRLQKLNTLSAINVLRAGPAAITTFDESKLVDGVAASGVTVGASQIEATSDFDLFTGVTFGGFGVAVDAVVRMALNDTGLLQGTDLLQKVTVEVALADVALEVDIRALLDSAKLDGADLGLFLDEGGLTPCGLSFFESSVAQNGGLQLLQAFFNAKYTLKIAETETNNALITLVDEVLALVTGDFSELLTDAVHSALDNYVRPMANDYLREIITGASAECAAIVPAAVVAPVIPAATFDSIASTVLDLARKAADLEVNVAELDKAGMIDLLPESVKDLVTVEMLDKLELCVLPQALNTTELIEGVVIEMTDLSKIATVEREQLECAPLNSMACWIKRLVLSAPTVSVSHVDYPTVNATLNSLVCQGITFEDASAGVKYGDEIPAKQEHDIAAVYAALSGAGLSCQIDVGFSADILGVPVAGSVQPTVTIKDTEVGLALALASEDGYKLNGARLVDEACVFGLGMDLHFELENVYTAVSQLMNVGLETASVAVSELVPRLGCELVGIFADEALAQVGPMAVDFVKDYVKPHIPVGPLIGDVDGSEFLNTAESPIFKAVNEFNEFGAAGRKPVEMFNCVANAISNSTGATTLDTEAVLGETLTIALGLPGVADLTIALPAIHFTHLNTIQDVSLLRTQPGLTGDSFISENFDETTGAFGPVTTGRSQIESTSDFDLFNGFAMGRIGVAADFEVQVNLNRTGLLQGGAPLKEKFTVEVELIDPSLEIDFRAMVANGRLSAVGLGELLAENGTIPCVVSLFDGAWENNGGFRLLQSFLYAKYSLRISESENGIFKAVDEVLGLATGSFGSLMTDAVHSALDNLVRPYVNDLFVELSTNSTADCSAVTPVDIKAFNWRETAVAQVVAMIEDTIRAMASTGIPSLDLHVAEIAECFISPDQMESVETLGLVVGEFTDIAPIQLATVDCEGDAIACFAKRLTIVAPTISIDHAAAQVEVESLVCGSIVFTKAEANFILSADLPYDAPAEDVAKLVIDLVDAGVKCEAVISYNIGLLSEDVTGVMRPSVEISKASLGMDLTVASEDGYATTDFKLANCQAGLNLDIALGFDANSTSVLGEGVVGDVMRVLMDSISDITTSIVNNVLCDVINIAGQDYLDLASETVVSLVDEYVISHIPVGPLADTFEEPERFYNPDQSTAFTLIERINNGLLTTKTPAEMINCLVDSFMDDGTTTLDLPTLLGAPVEFNVTVPGVADFVIGMPSIGVENLNTFDSITVFRRRPAAPSTWRGPSRSYLVGESSIQSTSDYDIFNGASMYKIVLNIRLDVGVVVPHLGGLLQGVDRLDQKIHMRVQMADPNLQVDVRAMLNYLQLSSLKLEQFVGENGAAPCAVALFEGGFEHNGGLKILQSFFNAKYEMVLTEENDSGVIGLLNKVLAMTNNNFGPLFTDAVHAAMDNWLRPLANDYLMELAATASADCAAVIPNNSYDWRQGTFGSLVAQLEEALQTNDWQYVVNQLTNSFSSVNSTGIMECFMPQERLQELIPDLDADFEIEIGPIAGVRDHAIALSQQEIAGARKLADEPACTGSPLECMLRDFAIYAPTVTLRHPAFEMVMENLVCKDIAIDQFTADHPDAWKVTNATDKDYASFGAFLDGLNLSCGTDISYKIMIDELIIEGAISPRIALADTLAGLSIVFQSETGYTASAARIEGCKLDSEISLRLEGGLPSDLSNLLLDPLSGAASVIAREMFCGIVGPIVDSALSEGTSAMSTLVADLVKPHTPVGEVDGAYDTTNIMKLKDSMLMNMLDSLNEGKLTGRTVAEMGKCLAASVSDSTGTLEIITADLLGAEYSTFNVTVQDIVDLSVGVPAIRIYDFNTIEDVSILRQQPAFPGGTGDKAAFKMDNYDEAAGLPIGPVTTGLSAVPSLSDYDLFNGFRAKSLRISVDVAVKADFSNSGMLAGGGIDEIFTIDIDLENPALEVDVRAMIDTAQLSKTAIAHFLAEGGALDCAIALFEDSMSANGGLQLLQAFFNAKFDLALRSASVDKGMIGDAGLETMINSVIQLALANFGDLFTDVVHSAVDNYVRPMLNDYLVEFSADARARCAQVDLTTATSVDFGSLVSSAMSSVSLPASTFNRVVKCFTTDYEAQRAEAAAALAAATSEGTSPYVPPYPYFVLSDPPTTPAALAQYELHRSEFDALSAAGQAPLFMLLDNAMTGLNSLTGMEINQIEDQSYAFNFGIGGTGKGSRRLEGSTTAGNGAQVSGYVDGSPEGPLKIHMSIGLPLAHRYVYANATIGLENLQAAANVAMAVDSSYLQTMNFGSMMSPCLIKAVQAGMAKNVTASLGGMTVVLDALLDPRAENFHFEMGTERDNSGTPEEIAQWTADLIAWAMPTLEWLMPPVFTQALEAMDDSCSGVPLTRIQVIPEQDQSFQEAVTVYTPIVILCFVLAATAVMFAIGGWEGVFARGRGSSSGRFTLDVKTNPDITFMQRMKNSYVHPSMEGKAEKVSLNISDPDVPEEQRFAPITIEKGRWMGRINEAFILREAVNGDIQASKMREEIQQAREAAQKAAAAGVPFEAVDGVSRDMDLQELSYETGVSMDAMTGSSMCNSPALPRVIRRVIVPAVLLLNFVYFLIGHLAVGASVMVLMEAWGVPLNMGVIFKFTLESTLMDMWHAKVYPLFLLILLFSGALPYVKTGSMLACWVLPERYLPFKVREKILFMLDQAGKWALIDTFVMVLMMVAFQMDLPVMDEGNMMVKSIVRADIGFHLFVIATIISLCLSHFILLMHRSYCMNAYGQATGGPVAQTARQSLTVMNVRPTELNERDAIIFNEIPVRSTDESVQGKIRESIGSPSRRVETGAPVEVSLAGNSVIKMKLTKSGISAMLFLCFVALLLIFVGSLIPTFHFTISGITGWLLPDETVTIDYSAIGVGVDMPSVTLDPSSLGTKWMQFIYFLFLIVTPCLYFFSLITSFLFPMRAKALHAYNFFTEVMLAWSGVDVFVVSIAGAVLQISQMAESMVKNYCEFLVPVFHSMSDVLNGQEKCFTVVAVFEAGIVVLVFACIFFMLSGFFITSVAHKSQVDRHEEYRCLVQNALFAARVNAAAKDAPKDALVLNNPDEPLEYVNSHSPIVQAAVFGAQKKSLHDFAPVEKLPWSFKVLRFFASWDFVTLSKEPAYTDVNIFGWNETPLDQEALDEYQQADDDESLEDIGVLPSFDESSSEPQSEPVSLELSCANTQQVAAVAAVPSGFSVPPQLLDVAPAAAFSAIANAVTASSSLNMVTPAPSVQGVTKAPTLLARQATTQAPALPIAALSMMSRSNVDASEMVAEKQRSQDNLAAVPEQIEEADAMSIVSDLEAQEALAADNADFIRQLSNELQEERSQLPSLEKSASLLPSDAPQAAQLEAEDIPQQVEAPQQEQNQE